MAVLSERAAARPAVPASGDAGWTAVFRNPRVGGISFFIGLRVFSFRIELA